MAEALDLSNRHRPGLLLGRHGALEGLQGRSVRRREPVELEAMGMTVMTMRMMTTAVATMAKTPTLLLQYGGVTSWLPSRSRPRLTRIYWPHWN